MMSQERSLKLPTLERVMSVLVEHGYRLTRPRRVIVRAVLEHERPFSAETIVAEVGASDPSLGRATVYRTLEILAAIDVLKRILRPDGQAAYVVGNPGHRHHLVCSTCGETVAFTTCPVDSLVHDLTKSTDFRIHGHLLEVFGLCPQCQVQA